jgi:hypothetical protein
MVPELVILEKTGLLFFAHFNRKKIPCFLVRQRNEIFVSEKREETDEKCNDE